MVPTTLKKMCKTTPETRTPPLIRTLLAVPTVSRIEEFHCLLKVEINNIRPYQFDFMLLGQKWLANEVGRSI